MSQRSDIAIGTRFSRLVVLAPAGMTPWRERTWLCACDCGREAEVRGKRLRGGLTRSCGCLGRDSKPGLKHGKRGTPTYSSWRSMKYRCESPTSKDWPRYGGAGIVVAPEWSASFERFFADMGARPAGTSLDRINVLGNYEPGNCRWATDSEQQQNRRMTAVAIYEGRSRRIPELAAELDLTYGATWQRARRGKFNATHG